MASFGGGNTDCGESLDLECIVVGAGIGGLTTALRLHQAGVKSLVFERAAEILEIGAGINALPNAVEVLQKLGLGDAIGSLEGGRGILTNEVRYYTDDGALVVTTKAGDQTKQIPQYSLHRAWLHSMLYKECKRVLGEDAIKTDHEFVKFEQDEHGVTAHFKSSRTGEGHQPVHGAFLIGADGLKSKTRSQLYPGTKATFTGWTCFRGMAKQERAFLDGRTMALSGRGDCIFTCYPIDERALREGGSLTNWGGMVYIGKDNEPPPESWNRRGSKEDVLNRYKDFSVPWGSPHEIIQQTPADLITEYALFDRDPMPRWSFGRVTLLGDAAHPLLPFGSQGAAQAILDADCIGEIFEAARLARASGGAARPVDVTELLTLYDQKRNAPSAKVVLNNRRMGPTSVLRVVHEACGAGADREEKQRWIDAHRAELLELIASYKQLVGPGDRGTAT